MRFPFPMRGGRLRSGRRGGGIGLFGVLVILAMVYFLGIDPRIILHGGGAGPQPMPPGQPTASERTHPRNVTDFRVPGSRQRQTAQQDDSMKKFVSVVLAETEDLWRTRFRRMGRTYREPKLVLFSGYTRTRCGPGMSAMGPFYCPLDQNVYIDLSFYRELKNKFGAGGDFAQAYVIAHEVGHHVQTLLGITNKVQQLKQRASKREANAIQVRMELQADCLAGVWAHAVNRKRNADGRPVLEQGDIEEALNAAAAIGDDQIQRRTQGYVVKESFTHGSSKQRQEWFYRGFETGDSSKCDTFARRVL